MRKKILTRAVASILAMCLMLGYLGVVPAFATGTDGSATSVADDPNLYVDSYVDFVKELKVLEGYAASFSAISGKGAGLLVLNFLRTGVDRYNDSNWKALAGEEITEFTAYVQDQDAANQTTAMRLRNIKLFTIPNGQSVDFGHMFGTMNISYIASIQSADLGGWAGDICDLMSYAKNYGNVPAGTIDEMAEYIRINCFGVNAEEAYGMDDFYGDMDAIYLIAQMKSGMALSVAMENYFTVAQTDKGRAEYFLKNRFENLYTKESVRNAVYNAYISNVGLQVLEAGRGLADETDLRMASCYAFADYVYGLAGDTLEEPKEEPTEPGEPADNPYYTVFSTMDSVLAPGITQTIKYAQTSDNKQIVYYIANVDVTRDDVTIMAGYKDADPSKGWGMQRVVDQANAMNAKHSDPNDPENYIENFQAIVATNGAGFNMSTGEPGGLLVMNGYEWHPVDGGGFFAILKDGSAMIGTTADYAVYKDQIQEAIAGFGAMLVKDGVIVTKDNSGRASRTAIGIKADGSVVMMVLDGRQEPFSAGGSMVEIAQIMLDAGCQIAINLDGGGSTTFAAKPEGADNVQVVNRPSDGYQRSVSTSLIAVSTAKSSKEFDHAIITSDYDYLTIGTNQQMTAGGVSNTGNAAPLPEGAFWAVSDEAVGTITAEGVFTALNNGDVEVYLMSGNKIVGVKQMHVVIPDALGFEKNSLRVVFGVPVRLPVTASYDGNPVAISESDVELLLTNENAGTFDGFTFTADETNCIRNFQIAAFLLLDEEAGIFALLDVSAFKADEAYFDFDNVTSGNRTLAWLREVGNAVMINDMLYQIVDPDEAMITRYTFALDMSSIEIPEQLEDIVYMLPGADQGSTAWDYLLMLAERISVLTEVKITVQLDEDVVADISEMKISNEYFALKSAVLDENNLLTVTCSWIDQTQAIDPATANPICILSGIKLTPKDGAAWDKDDQLSVINNGHVSYRIYLRASSLYGFACKPENQAKYGLMPYSGDQEEFYYNGEPLMYDGKPEAGAYFSATYADFVDTFTLDRSIRQGWCEVDGKMMYYVDHVALKDCFVELPGQEDPENKYFYRFDADGVYMGKVSGLVPMEDGLYYAMNGVAKTGWQSVSEGSGKVNYYFFHPESRKAVDGSQKIAGYHYEFVNCILVRGELVVDTTGTRYMWAGAWATQEWLEIDGKIAYARSNGYFENRFTYRYSPEGDWTYYAFGADGWLMTEFSGNYEQNGEAYLINKGVITDYPGLFELEGDLYYITSNKIWIKNRQYWISKTNGIVPEGSYWFDADGKMTRPDAPKPEEPKPEEPKPEEPVKSGIYAEDGSLYYYENGVRTYAGLIEIDGNYYYVRTSGELAHDVWYWPTKTNGLMETTKQYYFDSNGIMQNHPFGEEKPEEPKPEEPKPEEPVKSGIYAEDNSLYYYQNGVRTYAGLIYLDGYYYYVRTSGELAWNCKYWPTKTNGLMHTTRQYTFDELGRMTDCDFGDPDVPGEVKNGIVEEDGRLFYYVDGVRTYAGLICIEGNWYYVRTSGELVRNQWYWPTKTNGYMTPKKQYYFNSDGIMWNPPAELLEFTSNNG